ncbi:MAG: sulfurtransferase [Burkholderiaceae bacterium]|nr:sulfurtransferase [Burkholderiaceae bacterium]
MNRLRSFIVGCVVLLVTPLALAQQLPGPVVTGDWLAANQSRVQIVDVRSDVKSYIREPITSVDKKTGKIQIEEAGGYIPGALTIDYALVRSERMFDGQRTKYLIPEKEELQSRLRFAGVRDDKPIVIVPVGMDPSDVMEALRLYWTLKVYGEDRVAVLDGGMAGWLAAGRAIQTAAPVKSPEGDWSVKGYRANLVKGSADVEQASASGNPLLVDGREASGFYGVTKRSYVAKYGHIANAKSLPPELLFRSAQGALYFFNKAQYQSLFKLAGIDAASPAIAYCNSGNLASGAWFVLSEILGNTQTGLYDGSLYLWSREGRPLVGVL